MAERLTHEIFKASAAMVGAFDLPEPEFQFRIGFADSHLDLLEGRFTDTGGPELLADRALSGGRVLLHGEGGSGKSTIARRLLCQAAAAGRLPVLVDLREWRPDLLEEWMELQGDPAARADLLLDRLGRPSITEEQLGSLESSKHRLIVLDGLNETPGPTAQSILEVAEGIASRNPMAGVLVTDRLLRRSLPGRHWKLALVADVAAPDGVAVPEHGLVRSNAFFLSLALDEGLDAATSTAVLDQYLERHVELHGDELARAARASAMAYKSAASRSFPYAEFAEIAGASATEKLEGAGLLRSAGDLAIFRHHLFHDDLAARWLAGASQRWSRLNFEAVTFDANSFDVLALALARVREPDEADTFVLSVYDYNYYGTAYALAEGQRLGEISVTDDTRLAILSMLAERRWDQVRPTVEQVEDALRLFNDDLARRLREASDFASVLAIVRESDIRDSRIGAWRELFAREPGSDADDSAVELLSGDDPLLGWTAANVLRRTVMADDHLPRVWEVLERDERAVVRWRAAHALGMQLSETSVAQLHAATGDPDGWVRYGAVRSLVDLAATHETLRQEILETLESNAERLVEDPKTARELERSLQRTSPPTGWIEAVTPLVEALWAKAPTIERSEHWRAVARQIQLVNR